MSEFGKYGSGGTIPTHPYVEVNNDKVIITVNQPNLGGAFEGTAANNTPDSFCENPPSSFGAK